MPKQNHLKSLACQKFLNKQNKLIPCRLLGLFQARLKRHRPIVQCWNTCINLINQDEITIFLWLHFNLLEWNLKLSYCSMRTISVEWTRVLMICPLPHRLYPRHQHRVRTTWDPPTPVTAMPAQVWSQLKCRCLNLGPASGVTSMSTFQCNRR